jgi:transposase-like protein
MGYQINNDNNDKDEAIKKMFKLMMEALMEGERNAFLGYEKYDYLNKQTQNSRNGYYKRDLLTTLGNITSLAVPRDRLGEFASEFIDAYEHSTKPVDKLILELYAKGMSSRDIVDVIEKLYGKKLSPQQVSEITKEVEE